MGMPVRPPNDIRKRRYLSLRAIGFDVVSARRIRDWQLYKIRRIIRTKLGLPQVYRNLKGWQGGMKIHLD
jgi:hypothetical protein